MAFLARFGLLILAAVIVLVARRLHTKAKGSSAKAQKNVAAVGAFLGGLCLMGTIAGGWMATITGASPYIAAALFIVTAGWLTIDLWADKVADKPAFWCAVLLPMAVVFGLSQMSHVGDLIQQNSNKVGTTISQQSGSGQAKGGH